MAIYFRTCVNICRHVCLIARLLLENPKANPLFFFKAVSLCKFVKYAGQMIIACLYTLPLQTATSLPLVSASLKRVPMFVMRASKKEA